MTPAELKTYREALGLPVSWVAEAAGVQRRTVEYWESGKSPVPQDVSEMIIELELLQKNSAEQALRVALEQRELRGQPGKVTLKRYRHDAALWDGRPDMKGFPVTFHAQILVKARLALIQAGFDVELIYADS